MLAHGQEAPHGQERLVLAERLEMVVACEHAMHVAHWLCEIVSACPALPSALLVIVRDYFVRDTEEYAREVTRRTPKVALLNRTHAVKSEMWIEFCDNEWQFVRNSFGFLTRSVERFDV